MPTLKSNLANLPAVLTCPRSAGLIMRHSQSVRGLLRSAQREGRSRTKEQVPAHITPAFDIPASCAASPQ